MVACMYVWLLQISLQVPRRGHLHTLTGLADRLILYGYQALYLLPCIDLYRMQTTVQPLRLQNAVMSPET